MRVLPMRVGATVGLLASLLMPFAAHAQYTGTNGSFFVSNNLQIDAVDLAGTGRTNIVAPVDGLNFKVEDVDSTSGKLLFRATDQSGGTYALYTVNADGSNLVSISSSTTLKQAKFSSDGTKVYFIDSGNGLNLMNVDGTGITNLIPNGPGGNITSVAVAANGLKIAYAQLNTTTNAADVFFANADGTAGVAITTAAATELYAPYDFSPDSSRLIIGKSNSSTGGADLRAVNATDGTASVSLFVDSGKNVTFAQYSADFAKVAYVVDGTGVFTVNPDGTGAVLSGITTDTTGKFNWTHASQGVGVGGPATIVLPSVSPSPSPAPAGLPAASRATSKIPVALLMACLVSVAGIETTRRVRARRAS